MSSRTKLAGKLPGDEPVNGVDHLAEALCDRWLQFDPDNPAAVLIIGVAKVRKFETVNSDAGVHRVPTLEITRLEVAGVLGREPMPTLGTVPLEASRMLLDLSEDRTGSEPLPIDAETALDNHAVLED